MLENYLRINPQVEQIIAEQGINRNTAIMALTVIQYGDEDALGSLLDSELLSESDEHIIRLHLLNRDHENGGYSLRVPLFTVITPSEYQQFIDALIEGELGSYGLPTNPLRYTVFSDDEQLKNAYDYTKLRLGKEFDQDTLIQVILTYYLHCESPKGLTNYLRDSAIIDYRNGRSGGQVIRGVF